jgi:hypothetical protein
VTARLSLILALVVLPASGCCPFSITAVSEAQVCKGDGQAKPEGIPFYLPKPLLVISKNFTYIEEAKVGLTQPPPIPNTFDHQAEYATLNATASISTSGAAGAGAQPGAAEPAIPNACCSTQVLQSTTGIPTAPDCSKATSCCKPCFTYQIIFVPDLTQKHFLRIKGGPGEVRAALNLVNGWMYTGLGPFYFKDSSTAQNILATGVLADFAGAGAANVINSAANLSKAFQQKPGGGGFEEFARACRALLNATESAPITDQCVRAEIHVLEPFVTPDGGTQWREINPGATHFEGLLIGSNKMAPAASDPVRAAIAQQIPLLAAAAIEGHRAEVQAEAAVRPLLQAQALAAVAGPSDPSTDKAVALQALTPPPPTRRGLFGWICGKRTTITNKEVSGPTTVTTP